MEGDDERQDDLDHALLLPRSRSREKKRFSQLELAEAAGFSTRQLARLEAGTANVPLTTHQAIAGGLGVRLHQLLPGTPGKIGTRTKVEEAAAAAELLSDQGLDVVLAALRFVGQERVALHRLRRAFSR